MKQVLLDMLLDMQHAMASHDAPVSIAQILAPLADEGAEVAFVQMSAGRRVRVTLLIDAEPEQATIEGLRAHRRHMASTPATEELVVIPACLSNRPALFTSHVAVTGLDASVIRQALIALSGAHIASHGTKP